MRHPGLRPGNSHNKGGFGGRSAPAALRSECSRPSAPARLDPDAFPGLVVNNSMPPPSSLLAQFNFQPWYFFLARDNLRWKQFHRLVTHQVIIISIWAPGARVEETRRKRVDPARQRAALLDGRGGMGAPSSVSGVSQGPEFSGSSLPGK